MRTFGVRLFAGLVFMLCLQGFIIQTAKAQGGGSVSFQTFYDELSPYGQWIDDPSYGYVWAPSVGADFRPYYSDGRWAMTNYGNTWVSNYDWGWAPFHYGRWTNDPYYGWLWIPGNTWGPAWVSWRHGGGNFGWAPLGPGVGLSISIGNWYAPTSWWCFTPQNYIYSGGYNNYWNGPGYNQTYINNTTIINNTTVINNNTYVYGPRRDMVESATGQRVSVYNIRNERNPQRTAISNNSVNIYRPNVSGGERMAQPKNVVHADDRSVRARGAALQNAGLRSNAVDRNNRIAAPSASTARSSTDLRYRAEQNNQSRAYGNRVPAQTEDIGNQRINNARAILEQRRQQISSERSEQLQNIGIQRQELSQRGDAAADARGQLDARRIQQAQQRTQQADIQRERAAQLQQQRDTRNMERQSEAAQQRIERQPVMQREWRRPEPQMQRQPDIQQRQPQMERPQMQRQERPQMQQRMERPQMQQRAVAPRSEPRGRR